MYAELFCKTNHSFLEGASRPSELVERAAFLKLRGLAITDRDGVYGMPKAYQASKEFPALKLLVGSELTFDDHPRIRFIASDRKAYGLMCRMITYSHMGTPAPGVLPEDPGEYRAHKEKGQASLPWATFLKLLETYPDAARGLVALPIHYEGTNYGELHDLFGDRLYLPLCRVLDGFDRARNEKAEKIAKEFGLKIVAVNDVHYHTGQRRALHDVITSIREGTTLREAGTRLFSNAERYLKSPNQMAQLFRDLPEALKATVEIADRCTFSPSELRYYYPSEWIPEGETGQSFLEKLVWKGSEWRYPEGAPANVTHQLKHELHLISQLKYADYFLTIWDIVQYARGKGILCQGRGSAANSAVCYVLGITAIDPVKMDLLFERFLSMERNEPPDIDVDFEASRREEVIQYVYEKYGRHRAGMVAAVTTYRTRLSTREISKVLEVPLEEVADDENEERDPHNHEIIQAPQQNSGHPPKPLASPKVIIARALADEIYGFPRHLSIHSGGFTLSRDPLIETVPIEPARKENRSIVQWDKDDLEAIGLLKVDLLSLGMLTAIQKTFELLNGKHNLANITHDDPSTWRMIQRADTIGVFQIESRAQMSMLPRLIPERFYDLVVQVAIVRPGPIVGKMVHPYLKRKRGQEKIEYPATGDAGKKLEKILGRTFGVPIFQEQVMKMAIDLAGFSPGEADELRRAIAAWKTQGSIERVGKKLREGLLKSGLDLEFVDRVFEQIKGFSEYGFPESHAASFAHLAWASSYLKCHHPAEFTCSLLNSQPMGFYSNHTLIADARRHGVRILPIHPQKSLWDCTLEVVPGDRHRALRLGWRLVRGMNEVEAGRIEKERETGGAFQSLSDFVTRTKLRPPILHQLAMGDTFKEFGYDPRHALWEVLSLSSADSSPTDPDQLKPGQQLAFALSSAKVPQELGAAPLFNSMSDFEAIRADFRSYRASVRGHPMQGLRKIKKGLPPPTIEQIRKSPNGKSISVAGLMIVRQRPPTAKGTCFGTLEDETGLLDLIFHREVFARYEELYWNAPFVIIQGKLQRDGHAISVIVKRLKAVFAEGETDLRASSHRFGQTAVALASRIAPIGMVAKATRAMVEERKSVIREFRSSMFEDVGREVPICGVPIGNIGNQ